MNILKDLHHIGIVGSTRGSQGGYELAIDPSTISLHDLIVAMQGPIKLVECAGEATPCTHDNITDADACRVSGHCAVQAPLQRSTTSWCDFCRMCGFRMSFFPDPRKRA